MCLLIEERANMKQIKKGCVDVENCGCGCTNSSVKNIKECAMCRSLLI